MAKESDALVGSGHFAETRATVYLGLPEAGLPEAHPRARLADRAADLVPPSHTLCQLYEWEQPQRVGSRDGREARLGVQDAYRSELRFRIPLNELPA